MTELTEVTGEKSLETASEARKIPPSSPQDWRNGENGEMEKPAVEESLSRTDQMIEKD